MVCARNKKRSEVKIVLLHSLDQVSTAEKFTRIQPWNTNTLQSNSSCLHFTHIKHTLTRTISSAQCTPIKKCLVMNEKVCLWRVNSVNVDFFFFSFFLSCDQMMTAVKAENHVDVCFLKKDHLYCHCQQTPPPRCSVTADSLESWLGFYCVPNGGENNNFQNSLQIKFCLFK